MKVLIISSCSGEKKFSSANSALAKDLDDFELRMKKEEELSKYKIKAREMFISSQNKFIEEGLKILEQNEYIVEYSFISSGYGYITSEDYVIPYDVNLSVMSAYDNEKRGNFFKINEELCFSAKNYDLIFFLLSHEYLRMLNLPLKNISETTKQIFFLTKSDSKVINDFKNIIRMDLGNEEITLLGVKASELKGYIFKLIANESKEYNVLEEIYKNPKHIDTIILKNKKNIEKEIVQMNLFDNI